MAVAISLQRLSVTYPGGFRRPPVQALRPLDLEVAAGAVLGVLGPNGSGKTTLLRAIAGLQRPTTGTVRVLDLPPHDRALRRALSFLPDGPLPFGALSALQFLRYMGALLQLPAAAATARAQALLERLDLLGTGRRPLRSFSTGMQKRLAIAAALLPEPRVLLLDEPTAGLDPLGSAVVMTILQELAQAGCCVLLASHHLQEVEQVCSEVIVLADGELRARGTFDQLLGTDATAVVVRGVDAAGLQAVTEVVRRSGGEVVRTERTRQHLFALFRRLRPGGNGSGSGRQQA